MSASNFDTIREIKDPALLNTLESLDPPPPPKVNCFRIKEAAEKAFFILSLCLTASLIISASLTLVHAAAPIALVALTVSSIALGVLLFLKGWQLVTPHLPRPIRLMANNVQSVFLGFLSILAQMVVAPIDLTKANPKTRKECNPHQTPILMIHGYLGSSNNWIYHRHILKNAGFDNLFTINLGGPFQSIDDYSKAVLQMVLEIQKLTDRKDLKIFVHSMGGLVGEKFIQDYAESIGCEVTHFVSMGTPFDGTYAAYLPLGLSESANQMKPFSDFVTELKKNASEKEVETKYLHMHSEVDFVIWPRESAKHSGSKNATSKLLNATGHVPFLFSDTAANSAIEFFLT